MYIPKFFTVTDMDEVESFIQEHSFGTLVTTKEGKPIATHIPLEFSKKGDEYYITGHMAYGNPQWRTFQTCENALVIYQGPHAYISSSWYHHENVPTWNYQSVHVYGKPKLLEKEELKQDLAQLLKKYEKHRENPVLWESLSSQLVESELKGIVGFQIQVQEIQAAYKLSQNRKMEDYQSIIEHLKQENRPDSHQMAEIMKKQIDKTKKS